MSDLLKDNLSGFSPKHIDSVIVVDFSSGLKILEVEIKAEIKVSALKVLNIPSEEKEDFINSSISDFLKEAKSPHKKAILCPALKSLLIKRIQLTGVPEAELLEAVKWRIKEDVHLDLNKSVMDFRVVRRITKEDGSKLLDIICAIADEEEIKKQVLVLKQLGLSCLSVNFLPFSYAKIVEKHLAGALEEAKSILHLEENICYLAIYKNNQLDFYRELPVTINKFKESLTVSLITEKGKAQLNLDEINEVLFKSGIPIEGSAYQNKMAAGQILAMLRPDLERLAQEIKRSIIYYDSQFQGGVVRSISIGGKATLIQNLDKFLSGELSLDVSMLSLGDRVKVSNGVDANAFRESCGSLSLAFDFESGINLLPAEFRSEKIERVEKASLRWVAFIAFLLLVVSFLLSKAGVAAYHKRLNAAIFELNVLSEIKQVKTKIDAFGAFTREINNLDAPLGEILKKMSALAPRELFFSQLNLNCDTKVGTISGLVKSRFANSDTVLTKFVGDLNRTGYFKNVNITSVNKTSADVVEVIAFQINFILQ